jgi:hypothetical protein
LFYSPSADYHSGYRQVHRSQKPLKTWNYSCEFHWDSSRIILPVHTGIVTWCWENKHPDTLAGRDYHHVSANVSFRCISHVRGGRPTSKNKQIICQCLINCPVILQLPLRAASFWHERILIIFWKHAAYKYRQIHRRNLFSTILAGVAYRAPGSLINWKGDSTLRIMSLGINSTRMGF